MSKRTFRSTPQPYYSQRSKTSDSGGSGGASNLENGSGTKSLVQKESETFTLNGVTYSVDATKKGSAVFGGKAAARGSRAFASGSSTVASGDYSHTEGVNTLASGNQAHAEGSGTQATSASTHAEGISTIASSEGAHAEGNTTVASGASSHAEGNNTVASGGSAHAEGTGTIASKTNAHAEGLSTTADGIAAHAEGKETTVSNDYAHAEGIATIASAVGSHAEGYQSKATGYYAHAQGNNCEAHGQGSFATGHGNVAWQDYQTAIGEYNKNKVDTLFEVGNGTGSESSNRKNAFEVYKDGKVFAEKLTDGTTTKTMTEVLAGGGHQLYLHRVVVSFKNENESDVVMMILSIINDSLDEITANDLLNTSYATVVSTEAHLVIKDNDSFKPIPAFEWNYYINTMVPTFEYSSYGFSIDDNSMVELDLEISSPIVNINGDSITVL